jgi:hypothetical protein
MIRSRTTSRSSGAGRPVGRPAPSSAGARAHRIQRTIAAPGTIDAWTPPKPLLTMRARPSSTDRGAGPSARVDGDGLATCTTDPVPANKDAIRQPEGCQLAPSAPIQIDSPVVGSRRSAIQGPRASGCHLMCQTAQGPLPASAPRQEGASEQLAIPKSRTSGWRETSTPNSRSMPSTAARAMASAGSAATPGGASWAWNCMMSLTGFGPVTRGTASHARMAAARAAIHTRTRRDLRERRPEVAAEVDCGTLDKRVVSPEGLEPSTQ